MGAGKARGRKRHACRIMISEIRDRENTQVPRSALKSIIDRISQSMGELGLKASIEAVDK